MVWSTAQSALYKAVDDFNSRAESSESCRENSPEITPENCRNFERKNRGIFDDNFGKKSPENTHKNCGEFEQKSSDNLSEKFRRKSCDLSDKFCENHRKITDDFRQNSCENRSKNPRFFSENNGENRCEKCQKSQNSSDFAEKADCKNLQSDAKFTAKDCKNGIFANSASSPLADRDFILLAGLIFILMNEKADSKLILALVFVLLG